MAAAGAVSGSSIPVSMTDSSQSSDGGIPIEAVQGALSGTGAPIKPLLGRVEASPLRGNPVREILKKAAEEPLRVPRSELTEEEALKKLKECRLETFKLVDNPYSPEHSQLMSSRSKEEVLAIFKPLLEKRVSALNGAFFKDPKGLLDIAWKKCESTPRDTAEAYAAKLAFQSLENERDSLVEALEAYEQGDLKEALLILGNEVSMLGFARTLERISLYHGEAGVPYFQSSCDRNAILFFLVSHLDKNPNTCMHQMTNLTFFPHMFESIAGVELDRLSGSPVFSSEDQLFERLDAIFEKCAEYPVFKDVLYERAARLFNGEKPFGQLISEVRLFAFVALLMKLPTYRSKCMGEVLNSLNDILRYGDVTSRRDILQHFFTMITSDSQREIDAVVSAPHGTKRNEAILGLLLHRLHKAGASDKQIDALSRCVLCRDIRDMSKQSMVVKEFLQLLRARDPRILRERLSLYESAADLRSLVKTMKEEQVFARSFSQDYTTVVPEERYWSAIIRAYDSTNGFKSSEEEEAVREGFKTFFLQSRNPLALVKLFMYSSVYRDLAWNVFKKICLGEFRAHRYKKPAQSIAEERFRENISINLGLYAARVALEKEGFGLSIDDQRRALSLGSFEELSRFAERKGGDFAVLITLIEKHKWNTYSLEDSDDYQDLILYGTEVSGSCRSLAHYLTYHVDAVFHTLTSPSAKIALIRHPNGKIHRREVHGFRASRHESHYGQNDEIDLSALSSQKKGLPEFSFYRLLRSFVDDRRKACQETGNDGEAGAAPGGAAGGGGTGF